MKYEYSVKGIRDACEAMLKDAEGYDRSDIYESVKELRVSLDRLVSEFNKDVYSDRTISILKEDAECAALRLESILARVDSMYKERYLTRARILEQYECRKCEIGRCYAAKDAEKASSLLADLRTLGALASAVGHVKYYLTEEDVGFLSLLGVHGVCASQGAVQAKRS